MLAASFRRHHPAGRFFVLLVDRNDGYVDPEREAFELVEIDQLGIPDLPRFCFQYDILELNTAVKPSFLRHLFTRAGVRKLLYLDPDILVLQPLDELEALLDRHSILLTPHLTAEVPDDGRRPGERAIMAAGAYNLGFLGLRRDETVEQFLAWWEDRLSRGCLRAPSENLFVDQRWIDLVPGLYPDVAIIRRPGYNLAYWNVGQRSLGWRKGELRAQGEPVSFFHFSGFDPDDLQRVSRHQDRYVLGELPALFPLFRDYRTRLLAAGHATSRRWPYAFGWFDNGAPVAPMARQLYRDLGERVERFGDPFRTEGVGSFWRWLGEPGSGSGLSRFWREVYLGRPDLQRAFPDLAGPDRPRFLLWARNQGRLEYELSEDYGPPVDAPAILSGRGAAPRRREFGVNVVGYTRSEKGVGEALRATVRALASARLPYCVVDFPDPFSANPERPLAGLSDHNPYAVNLIQVNADMLPQFVAQRGAGFLRHRYNIGFWMWELPELPPIFQGSFSYLDEVWVGSNFVLDAIARVSPLPVVKVPLALPAEGLTTAGVGREFFGLPPEAFVFLFVFDVHSVVARKNPIGVIRAFRQAFKNGEDVCLVLKMVHGDRPIRERLEAEARDSRVLVVDRVLARAELNSLMDLCDCYVSLHRAEGFGLTIAEAMALGKPTIATAYSASMDFTTPGNSYLVRYDLVRLEEAQGPYPRGSVWAEPDVDHAAELMRAVYEDPVRARAVGQRAAHDIRAYLSPEVVGQRIAGRLEVLRVELEAKDLLRSGRR